MSLKSRIERLERASAARRRGTAAALDWGAYRDRPLAFLRRLWPGARAYDKQVETIESVRDNDETVVVAAHQVGKDWVAALTCLWFYLTRHPVRVITTSVKDDHLRVLWGEIGQFIDSCAVPLRHKHGGPLVVNHREIKKVVGGNVCPISYLLGMVSERGEGMAGHHAPHTLLVVDEASGVNDLVFDRGDTWAKRKLIFGNPYGGDSWFKRAVRGGDIARAA